MSCSCSGNIHLERKLIGHNTVRRLMFGNMFGSNFVLLRLAETCHRQRLFRSVLCFTHPLKTQHLYKFYFLSDWYDKVSTGDEFSPLCYLFTADRSNLRVARITQSKYIALISATISAWQCIYLRSVWSKEISA